MNNTRRSLGFTLIEILIAIAITGIVTTGVVTRFSKTSVVTRKAAERFITDLRSMQSRALSGTQYEDAFRCGFGITVTTETTYALYAGPDAGSVVCASEDRNFEDGIDATIEELSLLDPTLSFKTAVGDIFFEPPSGTAALDNTIGTNQAPVDVVIGPTETDCIASPNQCQRVCIFATGKIDLVRADGVCAEPISSGPPPTPTATLAPTPAPYVTLSTAPTTVAGGASVQVSWNRVNFSGYP
ncbi:MAG: prepilin-type N-terminal cleavage/methylation domain-containing protein, partial [Patescibacteria group bacterium]